MDLHLQFGFGMMDHCRALVSRWGGGTVILSPRDLTDEQLRRLAGEIRGINGGGVLLDPQFYLPHADHERLCSHGYWPAEYETGSFWQGDALRLLLGQLFTLNDTLGCQAVILPGIFALRIDSDWLSIQKMILEGSQAAGSGRMLYCTVALSSDALRDQVQIANLIESASELRPHGYYVVCEHPNGNYLIEDPTWLANVLDLVAALRLQGAQVIMGYCNQQSLIMGCAKANAIASGTWMNVRSFPPEKFRAVYEEEIRQRATWYYCPEALSEYKPAFLDFAQRQGVLEQMAVPAEIGGGYGAGLFTGAQPSAVGFGEQAAFRHYLTCLRYQAREAVGESFDETVARHQALLDRAEELTGILSSAGVSGQLRDFRDILDVNRAALASHVATSGPMLRRMWNSI
jgi:hypothetical protein